MEVNKNEKELDPILSINDSIDSSEFEWVGQDLDKMQDIGRPSISYWQDAFGRLKKDKAAIIFISILAIITVCAIIIPMIYPYGYADQHRQHINAAMFFSDGTCFHVFGTDGMGRDMFVRIWEGARISLGIAFVSVLVNGLIGVIYGGISGYFGGRIDDIMMRIVEIVNGIPYLLVVILLMTVMDRGMTTIIIALVAVGWVGMARLVRGQVIQLKEQEYVIAAKTMGVSTSRIIIKHLVPNLLSIIIVNLTLAIPSAIFNEAFLSFIGLGVRVPLASWGTLAQEGITNFRYYPSQLLIPAFFISITMLSFNLLGDKLRDAFDPRLRR